MFSFSSQIDEAVSTFQSLAALEAEVERAADLIRACLVSSGKLLVCGNGGSAADGADFSTEFTCRFSADRRPYPAINMAADGSLLTAIANDYSYDEVFARQVWAFAAPGDVVVAISTSGASKSILRTLEEANRKGVASISLLGKNGGVCKGKATVELLVRSQATARIQEAHKFLLHTLCEMVDPALRAG